MTAVSNMSCLIHLFALCVFDPSQVYLRGEASAQIAGDPYFYTPSAHAQPHRVVPLVGRLELGAYISLSKSFTIRYGVEHRSAINLPDRGEERAFIGFEWRPFQ